MTDFTNLLSLGYPNRLNFFQKFAKNGITLIESNIFVFRNNYTISKNDSIILYIIDIIVEVISKTLIYLFIYLFV